MTLRSPLSRARGLGSAKHGVAHWWAQRLTAIALVPLSLWFMASLAGMARADHAAVVAWIQVPFNTLLLLLFVAVSFYHAMLGMQVIFEDYVDSAWQKLACLLLLKFLATVTGLASIIAILRVAFSA